jgi:hypothetical protein
MALQHIHLHPEDLKARLGGKMLGEQPVIHDDCLIYDSHVGSWTELGRHTMLIESTFDDYSYTAGDVDIIYTQVGKFCSIASHVRVNPGNHPMWRVTQHHMTYRRKQYGFGREDDRAIFEWRRAHACSIGHDVWIGHGATIMPGVQVGTGAVIGAGAVVTKDIAPYTIAVGVPARPLRPRFAPEVIEKLLQIAWWDWSREQLEARFDDLLDTERFLQLYGNV